MSGDPANLEVYSPGERQRIPEAGGWAMITRKLPPLERALDREIRVGRVFYVERSGGNVDAEGFAPDGTCKALCRSPWGDVWLWPYEYSLIPVLDVVALWAAEELVFHPLQIEGARFNEIAFYARSRGIGLADAAAMALGTLSGSVGWFEPRADLAEECEALERSVHRPWPVRIGERASPIQAPPASGRTACPTPPRGKPRSGTPPPS